MGGAESRMVERDAVLVVGDQGDTGRGEGDEARERRPAMRHDHRQAARAEQIARQQERVDRERDRYRYRPGGHEPR